MVEQYKESTDEAPVTNRGERRRSMQLMLAIFVIFGFCAVALFFYGLVQQETEEDVQEPTPVAQEEPVAEEEPAEEFVTVGDAFDVDELRYEVQEVTFTSQIGGEPGGVTAAEGSVFVIAEVLVRNMSDGEESVDADHFELRDYQDNAYEPSSAAMQALGDVAAKEVYESEVSLEYGEAVPVLVAFEVPEQLLDEELFLYVEDAALLDADEQVVRIRPDDMNEGVPAS